jgi:hypothetical protein
MVLLSLLFAGAAVGAAFAAAVASAFGEAGAEASADGYAGAVCVASTTDGSVATTADYRAEAVSAPAAVVVAVEEIGGKEAAVAVGPSLLLGVLLVGAEAVIDDVVLFVDAALHLGLLTAGEHGERGGCEEWRGDLSGTFHVVSKGLVEE